LGLFIQGRKPALYEKLKIQELEKGESLLTVDKLPIPATVFYQNT
jgi:hypothetical protein